MKVSKSFIIIIVLLTVILLCVGRVMKNNPQDNGFSGTYVFEDNKKTLHAIDPALVITYSKGGNDNTYVIYNCLNVLKDHGIARMVNDNKIRFEYGALSGYYLVKEDNQYNLISDHNYSFVYKYDTIE